MIVLKALLACPQRQNKKALDMFIAKKSLLLGGKFQPCVVFRLKVLLEFYIICSDHLRTSYGLQQNEIILETRIP